MQNEQLTPRQIAIDGPAAAGKTTAAKILAAKIGYDYMDTGAIFRAIAYHALSVEKTLEDIAADPAALVSDCLSAGLKLKGSGASMSVLIGGKCVDEFLRLRKISDAASRISVYPAVRTAVLDLEHKYAQGKNIIAEGRDIGTKVFPDAALKIFLTAAPEARAERRCLQLSSTRGDSADYETILADIHERDARDSTRTESPLVPAKDAILIDNTDLTAWKTVKQIAKLAGYPKLEYYADPKKELPIPDVQCCVESESERFGGAAKYGSDGTWYWTYNGKKQEPCNITVTSWAYL